MGIICIPVRKPAKHKKISCPYASDSTHCLGTCKSHYKCALPKLNSRKRMESGRSIEEQKDWRCYAARAELQLRRSHGEHGLV